MPSETPQRDLTGTFSRWGLLIWVLTVLAFFRHCLSGEFLPLFRDGANLYYPLWMFVREQYWNGSWPFWDPYFGLGCPLAAEGIGAIFYPGIIVFLLPLPYSRAYLAFLLIHLILAGHGAYRLARQLGASEPVAYLALWAYPFSGYLLFQIYNPIYLVSGSWLPFALATIYRYLGLAEQRDRSQQKPGKAPGRWPLRIIPRGLNLRFVPDVVKTGLFLALMILGGDPQTAYHCLLVAAVTAVVIFLGNIQQRIRQRGDGIWVACCSFFWRLGYLLGVAGVAFLLSAIQVVPTAVYARQSDRYLFAKWDTGLEEPGGRPEDTGAVLAGGMDRWGEPPIWWKEAAEQARTAYWRTVYDFSTPIYRWLEFVWPGFGGRPIPVHTRWMGAFMEEGRWWVPALYQGLVSVVLALGAVRFWPRAKGTTREHLAPSPGTRQPDKVACAFLRNGGDFAQELGESAQQNGVIWLSWVGLLAALAALGWYGPGGTVAEIFKALYPDAQTFDNLQPPVGGLYWLLVTWLPGYALFRYPSKWLVFTCLSLAILAALGLEKITSGGRSVARRFGQRVLWLGLAGAVASLGLAGLMSVQPSLFSGALPDRLFGPFEPTKAVRELIASGLLLGCVAAVVWVISKRFSNRSLAVTVLVLSACDLVVHNGWLVFPVRPPCLEAEKLRGVPPARFWGTWCDYPADWERSSSPGRLQEICDHEFEHCLFRWPVVTGVGPLENYGTLMPAETRVLLGLLRAWMQRQGHDRPPDRLLARLGVCADGPGSGKASLDIPAEKGRAGKHSAECFVQMVHKWRTISADSAGAGNLWQRLAEMYFAPGGTGEVPGLPVVETAIGEENDPCAFDEGGNPPANPRGEEGLRLLEYRPGRVRLNVAVKRNALLVLRELAVPGWTVKVQSTAGDGPISCSVPVRVDGLFCGAVLPPGAWDVEFSYRPPGWLPAAVVSVLTWGVVVAWLLVRRLRTPWATC